MVGRLEEGGVVGRVPQKMSWMRLPGRLKGFLNTSDHGLKVRLVTWLVSFPRHVSCADTDVETDLTLQPSQHLSYGGRGSIFLASLHLVRTEAP